MNFIKEINRRNAPMANIGTLFLVLSMMLGIYATVNTQEILGINSMIKPLKFALSLWIFAWTMAYLLYYVNDQENVKKYTVLAIITMVYEQAVITIQAFRGKLSHFNQTEIVGGILYALMGIMIVWLTIATLILSIRFIRQKTYAISSSFALSIKIGLVMFVVFSFFGGYMSAINSHNVGGEIGGKGLNLLNWSTVFGDLRVAHFFGIHSLQIIPFLGYFISKNIVEEAKAKRLIWFTSIIYLAFVCFTMFQALAAMPFLKI